MVYGKQLSFRTNGQYGERVFGTDLGDERMNRILQGMSESCWNAMKVKDSVEVAVRESCTWFGFVGSCVDEKCPC